MKEKVNQDEKTWLDKLDGAYVPWIGVGVAAALSLIGVLLFA